MASQVTTDDFHATGPGTLAGRYLRRHWQPVYHVADLPSAKLVDVRPYIEIDSQLELLGGRA